MKNKYYFDFCLIIEFLIRSEKKQSDTKILIEKKTFFSSYKFTN